MLRITQLIQEIHRRGLWQATAAFLGIAWAILEVMDLFTGRGILPDWTFTGALVALALRFPVVLATAFVQSPGEGCGARWLAWSPNGLARTLPKEAFPGRALSVAGPNQRPRTSSERLRRLTNSMTLKA